MPSSSASGSRLSSSSAAVSWAMRRVGTREILPHPASRESGEESRRQSRRGGSPLELLPRTPTAPPSRGWASTSCDTNRERAAAEQLVGGSPDDRHGAHPADAGPASGRADP